MFPLVVADRSMVRASPLCLWIKEWLNEEGNEAFCETQRKGDPEPIERSYSMTDATLANVTHKANWQKYPTRMLQMRARAFCLRDAYPDVLKGLRMAEEVLDYDNTPAPIREFEIPTTTSGPVPVTFTVPEVKNAIRGAANMAALIAAGDMAKTLNEEDTLKVRPLYKERRDELMDAGADET